MKTMTLNGAWELEIPGSPFGAVSASVPGSVYHDLLTAGAIPDPFDRDNEVRALEIMEHDFIYRRCFTPEDALLWFKTIHEVFEKHQIARCLWSYKEMDFGLADQRMDPVRNELLNYI